MKVYNCREVVKILKENGYVVISQNGSHQKWEHTITKVRFVLPTSKEVNRMMWQRMVKQYHIICKF